MASTRREQITMDADEVDEYLAQQRILNVATIGPTGHPHLVAMWYVVRDGQPTFWTFAKSQKVVNIRRDPRVSALVESGDSYGELKGVELRGTARLVDEPAEVLEIGKAVGVKYTGAAAVSADALPFLEAQAAKRVGVVIEIAHVTSWDHTKLAGSY